MERLFLKWITSGSNGRSGIEDAAMNKLSIQTERMELQGAEPGGSAAEGVNVSEWLSALMDGEASDSEILKGLSQPRLDPRDLSTWHTYHLIGDVLREGHQGVTLSSSSSELLLAVRKEIADQEVLPQLPLAKSVPASTVRRDSANDAVFVWKMVAGFASVAAVAAISWTTLGAGAGAVRSDEMGAGARMAASATAGATVVPVGSTTVIVPTGVAQASSERSADSGATVVVNTLQGPMLRDPELEKLLAEHRHFGGASALQMPAGFMRSATQEAVGRP